MFSSTSELNSRIAACRCIALSPKKYFIGYDSGLPQFVTGQQLNRCVDFLSASLRSFALSVPDNISASIVGSFCQTLGPRKYFIGYEGGTPLFVEARPQYSCVSFLPAYLKPTIGAQKNLPCAIKISFSSYENLGTYIIAGKEIFVGQKDLNTIIYPYATLPGSMSASILGSYCQTLSPSMYFVGYDNGVPKFIPGKPRYRCVDFLSARINQVYYDDLAASIVGKPGEFGDLGSYIRGVFKQEDYSLRAGIRSWVRGAYKDLPAYIRGMTYRGITAYLKGLTYEVLPAEIYPIPPVDLPGYLKVWPMGHLPGRIHGWQEADLGAIIDWNDMRQLSASIGIHQPRNLTARIKGWVREATHDLAGWIRALQYDGLGGFIRGTYLEDLPAYLFCIQPENLTGFIHGWATKDLPAYLNGGYGPGDLQAYINIVGEPRDLPAYVRAMKATGVTSDLTAYVYPATILMRQGDLASFIATHAPSNLGGLLTPIGYTRSLPAFINPKMVFMTAAMSVSTMEHSDMGAIINFICRGSDHKNLGATIELSYLKELAAQIVGNKTLTYLSNMTATVGYAATYVHADRIPVSLTIGTGYRIEDKIPIIIDIFKQRAYLSATITGTYVYTDMGASLTPVWLQEYEFDNVKVREMVYDLNHAKQINWYEVVELYFQSIVPEYFYVAAENKVYKSSKEDRWRLDVASFAPENIELGVRRKLHRLKTLYDLTKFNSLDEAIRFAIHYVTSYDSDNLSSMITATGQYVNLTSRIIPKYFTTDNGGLNATISPQPQKFVLGYDDKVEFI